MYPSSIKKIIDQFLTLPGIGPKTAERLALSIASRPKSKIEEFINSFVGLENLKVCQMCRNFADTNPCEICSSTSRDKFTICVVSTPKELEAIERTHKYNGLYHTLGGLIDPIMGITPDKLFIKELTERIKNENTKELILAFDTSIQGEATITYLKNILVNLGVKITRLAKGIPMGTDIEYTDEITLTSALENRKELN
ncbi:MAG TPA: recombination mediator RecR [bacterium]|jgi:recombination protein RecR|nr:recombination mediator RecR [bacterium]HOG38062.1 recombination mediator RecR [bacterium]HQI03118.1 recombination mediator RecR [bacterium]